MKEASMRRMQATAAAGEVLSRTLANHSTWFTPLQAVVLRHFCHDLYVDRSTLASSFACPTCTGNLPCAHRHPPLHLATPCVPNLRVPDLHVSDLPWAHACGSAQLRTTLLPELL
eukprot:1257434-Pleurochrysis_carterae.AAC.1